MNIHRATYLSALVLVGCSGSEQTVDWYRQHETERAEKLAWCAQSADRGLTVDCMNAAKAKELALLNGKPAGQGASAAAADSFKFKPSTKASN